MLKVMRPNKVVVDKGNSKTVLIDIKNAITTSAFELMKQRM